MLTQIEVFIGTKFSFLSLLTVGYLLFQLGFVEGLETCKSLCNGSIQNAASVTCQAVGEGFIEIVVIDVGRLVRVHSSSPLCPFF